MKKYLSGVLAGIAVFVVFLSLLGVYQIITYENGASEIYAEQQDQYVKLVLKQIELQEDWTEKEIIGYIWSLLDSSFGEYWTLAKEERFVYVRDMEETEVYKGFTQENYYLSESARHFIAALEQNKISHACIDIHGVMYIVSGTAFAHQETEYKICLLTQQERILEQNEFLQAKITMLIVLFSLVLLLLIMEIVFVKLYQKKVENIKLLEHDIQNQNLKIEELEDKLAIENLYGAGKHFFHRKILTLFLDRLEVRSVPLTLLLVKMQKADSKEAAFRKLDGKIQSKSLKFVLRQDCLLFIYLAVNIDDIEDKPGDGEIMSVLGIGSIEAEYGAYREQFVKFMEKIKV